MGQRNNHALVLGLPMRFWAKTSIEDRGHSTPCVVWTGGIRRNGYGRFGRRVPHRVTYEALVGPIPDGLVLDHLCRVRACVAADHLEAVTHQVNILRGEGVAAKHAVKTHCIHGHEFTPENTYIRRGGKRRCRTCHSEQDRARREARLDGVPVVPSAERTHCPQGHPYDSENTYVDSSKKRRCRTCLREQRHARKATQTPQDTTNGGTS